MGPPAKFRLARLATSPATRTNSLSQSQCFAQHLDDDVLLDDKVLVELEAITAHRRVPRGEMIFQPDDVFRLLFFVQDGAVKNFVLTEGGQELVTGFSMPGDVIGLDGISDGAYASYAAALQECILCEIPYKALRELSLDVPALQLALRRMMNREVLRVTRSLSLLDSMPAEKRLLEFLLDLSQKFAAQGLSGSRFKLPMSTEEIASFLGLRVGTVNHAFAKLRADELIGMREEQVTLECSSFS